MNSLPVVAKNSLPISTDDLRSLELLTQIESGSEATDLLSAWQRQFLLGQNYWPQNTSGLSAMDWFWFSLGLFIGALVTIATSPFNVFFDPCVVQWATITAAAFFFYLYMSSYMDSNFSNNTYLIQMILNFVQFGQATMLGYCDDDHGFRKQGFHTSFGNFSIDTANIEALSLRAERLERALGIKF